MSPDRTDVLQGTLDLLVLRALSIEPMHGWGLAQRIEQMSGDVFAIQQGTHAVPGTAADEAQGLRRLDVAGHREQPASAVLLAHAARSAAARYRTRAVGAHCRRRKRGAELGRVMHMLREWLRRLWSLLRSGREDAEMQQEVRFHLDMETEKNLAAGMDAREARRQAHLRFGGMTPIQEAVRDARGVRPVSDMLRDIGLTLRSLRHSPLFTAVTVATLSLGIGATTAIFSFVDGILLSPLGYRQPDRLMTVQIAIPELADRFPVLPVNALSIDAWQRNCQVTCRGLTALQPVSVVVTGDGAPEPLRGARVSLGFFELLGIEPVLGRVFEDADSEAPDARVAVLTHGLWQRRYGGDPAVLGRIIVLDDQPVEVVGVLPTSFWFPRFADLTPVESGWSDRPEFFQPLAWSELSTSCEK